MDRNRSSLPGQITQRPAVATMNAHGARPAGRAACRGSAWFRLDRNLSRGRFYTLNLQGEGHEGQQGRERHAPSTRDVNPLFPLPRAKVQDHLHGKCGRTKIEPALTGAPDLGLQCSGKVAPGWRSQEGGELFFQALVQNFHFPTLECSDELKAMRWLGFCV